MEIHCPYCRNAIRVKDPKAGTYRPQCAKCSRRFLLTIPDAPAEAPRTGPLPQERQETVHDAPGDQATMAPTGSSAEVDATGQWSQQPVGRETIPAGPEATLADPGSASGPSDSFSSDVPAMLGGYRILRELGRGAMGAVYLARQISLDRNVALKVIQSRWTGNPVFLARFTREAYAAAQLVHPNVVQIYDLGCENDTYFFSMEFVEGETLADLVAREGKLSPDTAVRHVLQAARGLKFAHDQGMVHRDVKPDNLLLSRHGVVKLADLGLVKAAASSPDEAINQGQNRAAVAEALAAMPADITEANVAMGTPAYMAPEQAEDAANVDHRADIYSLGCTLYDLLTGRPPFQGASALEVITKHQSDPIERPDALVEGIPKRLAEINMKMVAKRPQDRYADLGEAITDMEAFLGIQSKGPFLPNEEHLSTLEQCVSRFHQSLTARLRPKIVLGFSAFCALSFVVGIAAGSLATAGGALGLAALAPLAYFAVGGWKDSTYLFLKVRELFLRSSWGDWLAGFVCLALLGGAVFLFIPIWLSLGLLVVAAVLGFAFHSVIDRRIEQERREPVEQMAKLLRLMRVQGYDETSIQEFVATYSGSKWEEFFEAVFGYEAKISARGQWAAADEGRSRDRFRAWRDPIIHTIKRRLSARQKVKDREHLQAVEVRQFEAQGLTPAQARQRAKHVADALVSQAAEIRRGVSAPATSDSQPKETPEQKRARIKAMLNAAHTEPPAAASAKVLFATLELLFGSKARFLVGGALLAAFFFWIQQNNLVPDRDQGLWEQAARIWNASEPLRLPMIPSVLTQSFGGINAGVAGLILVLSSFFAGLRVAAITIPAALLAVMAPLPSIAVADGRTTSLLAAAVLAVVGFLSGKRTE